MSTVAKRDHGSLAVRASLVGQMSYYWGGAWYSEKCPDVDLGRWSVSGEMYAFRSYSHERTGCDVLSLFYSLDRVGLYVKLL
jgi:hypothetical protein